MDEEIIAYGHPNVTARHRTTLEVTKDEEITLRADCILGVRADKSVRDLSEGLRRHLLEGGSIEVRLIVSEMEFAITARGDPRLRLDHDRDVVVRRSDYIDGRTLAIRSSAAASDVPREMVRLLRDPGTILRFVIVY